MTFDDTKILVAYEKHGNRIWRVQSPEKFVNTVASILGERLNEGYWYLEDEDVAFLKRLRSFLSEVECNNLTIEGKVRMAQGLLTRRRYHEYERVELETLDEANDAMLIAVMDSTEETN
jgi:hypothetical protein